MSARRHLNGQQFGSADDARAAVEKLSGTHDTTPYEQNAYDMGHREDADDDGLAYWSEVHSQAKTGIASGEAHRWGS